MAFAQTGEANGVYIAGTNATDIRVDATGVYNIQFSAQIETTVPTENFL